MLDTVSNGSPRGWELLHKLRTSMSHLLQYQHQACEMTPSDQIGTVNDVPSYRNGVIYRQHRQRQTWAGQITFDLYCMYRSL
jgi:hypothetical protein